MSKNDSDRHADPPAYPKPPVKRPRVHPHRVQLHAEVARDLRISAAAAYQPSHLRLSRRQTEQAGDRLPLPAREQFG